MVPPPFVSQSEPAGAASSAPVNAGARLDRLPMSGFHRRILWLIGIGMFFDGFDIYIMSTVLGATGNWIFARVFGGAG